MHSQGVDTPRTRQGKPDGVIDFDAAQAPCYVIRFPECVMDTAVEAVLARLREVWKTRRRMVVVCDASDSALTPRQRKLVTDEIKREHDNYARWVDGWALVVRSPVARHTLTALTWVSPPPFEMRVFETCEEARAWATQRSDELQR